MDKQTGQDNFIADRAHGDDTKLGMKGPSPEPASAAVIDRTASRRSRVDGPVATRDAHPPPSLPESRAYANCPCASVGIFP
jgi:hypothetical protein